MAAELVQNDPLILVLAPAELGFAREIVAGVRAWATAHADRHWFLRCGCLPEEPAVLARLKPPANGGAVAFLAGEPWEQAALDHYRTPVVNVSHNRPTSRLPRVLTDNVEVGRRAARHLLDRGFRHFAAAGSESFGFGAARRHGFTEELAEAGYACLDAPHGPKDLPAWLTEAPQPLGVMAISDTVGQQFVDLCHHAGLSVPEQVAVIGVDDDEHVCESTTPPLTSVDTRGYDVGYRAAAVLDGLMHGDAPPAEPVIVPCGEVITRRSTDTVAVADPQLNAALRFIRRRACEGIIVDDILDTLTISRRTLEQRFKKAFGRTLHEEIRRVQLEHARLLLSETELRIAEVAARCGFCDRRAFTQAFGAAFGTPPGRFRARLRQSA